MAYSKYRAVKTTVDGIKFDSKVEARRYKELTLLKKVGQIKDLELQPKFELQPAYVGLEGKKVRAIMYIADFIYYDINKQKIVIEDVKGMKTDVYNLKKKMFEFVHGMNITEIRG